MMTTISDYREIPLDDLLIGKGQVRTQDPSQEIDELVASIESQGLLQPIVVCQAQQEGKWEILTGQRRFLAHKLLKRNTIHAAVVDERVDPEQAKAISITENLIRKKLSDTDLVDGVTFLYNHYGTIKAVAEKTGLPRDKVSRYVKYPRLLPNLKELVDRKVIDVNVALKAQDASCDVDNNPNSEISEQLALEMSSMSGAQRKKLAQERRDNPNTPVNELIESAKTGSKITQIAVTLTQDAHRALQQFATAEESNQDEAAATLIEEALAGRGLLG